MIKLGKKRIAIHVTGSEEKFAIWLSQEGVRNINRTNISIPKIGFEPCSEKTYNAVVDSIKSIVDIIELNHDDVMYYLPIDEIMSIIKCPNCGSIKTIKIIYGLPSFELFKEAESGLIKLGGCIVDISNPKRFCTNCKNEFDRISINGLFVQEFNFSVGTIDGEAKIKLNDIKT